MFVPFFSPKNPPPENFYFTTYQRNHQKGGLVARDPDVKSYLVQTSLDAHLWVGTERVGNGHRDIPVKPRTTKLKTRAPRATSTSEHEKLYPF